MRIAIYGGSFDPPHLGHLAIIKKALADLDIDRLLIIPTYLNPFKDKAFADAPTRLLWMQKLTTSYDKVEVLDIESSQNQISTSYETLTKLKLRYNFTHKPYLIIGADNLKSLSQWYNYDQLKELVDFVVANRNDFDVKHSYKELDVSCDVSSTKLRHTLNKEDLPPELADEIMAYYKEHNEHD